MPLGFCVPFPAVSGGHPGDAEERRHVYYVCRAGKKRNPACPQAPVACLDLDRSLQDRLERMRGALPDAVAIQQLLQSVSYESVTRRVAVELRDGSRFEYLLPFPVRPGVRRSE